MSFWDYSVVAEKHLDDQGVALRLTSRNLSIASGRISYHHGYTGPCMTIDTACSSSLVGIHVAGKLLHEDGLESVRIGSAMLSLSSDVVKCLAAASMTSDHGRSRTLDNQASGYGRGEATAFLSISRNKNGIAVIKGSAMNQDGRSATLTAPNGPSQVALLSTVHHSCGILPLHTNLHELHGTGTQLGDPIETHALVTFQAAQKKAGGIEIPLNLSATKTIFGHSEPVAGGVGIYSLINQMDNYFRDPFLHLTQVSVHVSQALQKARRTIIPQRTKVPNILVHTNSNASVNAFAFQGTNASIILSSDDVSICESLIWKAREGLNRGKQWFLDKYHPCMYPIYNGSLNDEWMLNIKGNQMSNMMDHHVFGKALLPGVAMFRFMLDAAGLSHLESKTKLIFILRSSIYAPISLRWDSELQITITISRDSSKICTLSREAYVDQEFASGYCGQASRTYHTSKGKSTRAKSYASLTRTKRQKDSRWCISIGSLYGPGLVETVNLPSIESIDASTHLAAYNECIVNLDASIPISCEALHIKPKYHLSGRQKMEGSATCVDHSVIQCRRDYTMELHPKDIAQIHSLTSKRIQRKSRESMLVSYLSQEEQLISPFKTLSGNHRQCHSCIPQVNRESFTVSMNERNATLYLNLLLLLQEYIRTQMQSETVSFTLPSTSERGLLESQIRVASREIGLEAKILQFNPNEARMRYVYQTSTQITVTKIFEDRSIFRIPGYVLEGTSIVVGGTNGIGLLFCQWATHYNAERYFPICSLGKSGYIRGSLRGNASNAHLLTISSYNCASSSDNYALLTQLLGDVHSTKCSIFYSAGVTSDTYYMTSTIQSYRTTLSPKYGGFRALTAIITPSLPCMAWFSTSSMAIDIANIGQANYIASNNAMEILSKKLRDSGIASRSARFGPWKDLGLLHQKESTVDALSRQGLVSMTPLQGLRALIKFLISAENTSSIGILRPKSDSILSKGLSAPRKILEESNSTLLHVMSTPSEGGQDDEDICQIKLKNKILATVQAVLGVENVSDESPFFEVCSIFHIIRTKITFDRNHATCRLELTPCH